MVADVCESSHTPLTDNDFRGCPSAGLQHAATHAHAHSHAADSEDLDAPMPTNLPTGCACLSAMYLELSSMQAMTDFSFPAALHHLRKAIGTAYAVLNCDQCPKSFFTGFQNIQLLGLFMMCVAERYTKVLGAVDAEAQKALDANEKRRFRIGDMQGSNTHLHTADSDICLAPVELDLDPLQWRSLVKRVIKGEVRGTPIDCCPSFLKLTEAMIERQTRWHRRPPPIDYPRPISPEEMAHRTDHNEISNCIKLVVEARKIVDHMAFD